KFTCPLCDRSFTEKWAMNNHMKLHTGEKPYKCTWPTCHYSFLTASAMKDHYRTHTVFFYDNTVLHSKQTGNNNSYTAAIGQSTA
ncbi:hypothetical protein JRQ81_012525, partial [Phrynocephalus forsythii]